MLLLTTVLWPHNSLADFNRQTLVHVLLGNVSGSFTGDSEGEFSISQALNTEIEFLYNPKTSFILRNILAIDQSTSKNIYNLTSIGQRYYWKGVTAPTEIIDVDGSKYSILPKQRYYIGYDVGVSQVVVTSLGPILDAVSTMVDVGVNAGGMYQLTDKWAIEAQAAFTRTQGFSAISVTGTTTRLMAGLAFFF